MKSMNDTRCLPKRLEDRAEAPLLHPQSFNLLDGKTRPCSSKRKFHSAACEPPPPARKPESTLRISRGARPLKQLVCIRKSLSDPLQVFGDADGSDHQRGSLSGTTPSDSKDGLPKGLHGQHGFTDMEKLSKVKRHPLRPGLKDSTNLDPKGALKQNSSHICNEVLALKEALCAEKEAHRCLQAELDEERNASSSAANEAMAMIARLQKEKAAVLMEAQQFKRMSEERELHNQEAISLLKEMLYSKEEEALALENELTVCRQMFLAIEAGEPAENCGLKYLDNEIYHGRTLELEVDSAHTEEGHKSWSSSLYDSSKLFDVRVNAPSGKTLHKELINSEFNGRRYGRCFNDLISDNVRSNLESYFIQAGDSLEESQNYSDAESQRENIRTEESNRRVDILKKFPRGSQAAIHNKCKLSNGGSQAASQDRVEPPARFTDEQTRSLWERIMKLEHHLETFGVDEQGFEFEVQQNVTPASQTPGFISSEQQEKISPSDALSHSEHCSQEGSMKGDESVERPTKLQCRGGSIGFETLLRQEMDSIVSQQDHFQVSIGVSGINCSNSVAEPQDIARDAVEGVLDIYAVGYLIDHSSQNDCCISPADYNSLQNQTGAPEDSGLPPELSAPDLETMDVDSHSSLFSPSHNSDGRNTSSSLSEAEKQQLNMRLQLLESEKHAMHQAILSLQTENKQLKLLQEMASKLKDLKQPQNLKRNVQSSEQPSKRAKSEQPSFTSFLRGFFSYLPSNATANLQECSSGVSLRNPVFSLTKKDHVGLSHLLEKSPHLKTETLILRGLRVKVPAAI